MLYSDDELKKWWDSKSGFEKTELFELILSVVDTKSDNKSDDGIIRFVNDLKSRSDRHMSLSPRQISFLRKWHR
jgi:hypothetical protein